MTQTQTQTRKMRTITLTGRPPVKIVEDDWPCIAVEFHNDGEVECQANRTWLLRVRAHADGRRIVYGVYTTCYPGEYDLRHGELTVADMTATAIRSVGRRIGAEQWLIDHCIANLPAEEI